MARLMTEGQRETFWRALEKAYPNPKCELNWTSHFTLLMAIILSAQSTDKTVNKIQPCFFAGKIQISAHNVKAGMHP